MSLFRDLYQNPNDDHTINLMMIVNRFVKSKSELSLLLFSLYLLLLLDRECRDDIRVRPSPIDEGGKTVGISMIWFSPFLPSSIGLSFDRPTDFTVVETRVRNFAG